MEIPEDQLTELYLVRGLLEGYGAKRAAHLANDTDIEELEVLTKEYERLVEEGQTNGFDEINEKFHQKILSFCGPIVNRMMKEIRVYTARTQKMALSQDHRPQEVIKEHRALVEAIRNHQAEEADRITRKHMEGGLRAAKKYLES
jgi:DNA-binding GntR family transcriptional regulator